MNIKKHKAVIIGIIAFVLLYWLWRLDAGKGRNNNRIIRQDELTELRGTISNDPTIETAEQGGPWVPIKLNEYPEFEFDVREVKYSAFEVRAFINEVSIGDSIVLDILTYDYTTKIKREKPLRPSETFINYSDIEPYSIKSKGKTFMTLSAVNEEWKKNNDLFSWIFRWILKIGGFVVLIYLILYFTGIKKRIIRWWEEIHPTR